MKTFLHQMQLERLLARQMEILQDAAVQERLQALDWRIPPAALKYLNNAQNTNGAAADANRDNQGGTWAGEGALAIPLVFRAARYFQYLLIQYFSSGA